MFFVLVISIGIFTLILQDLGSFHVDTGDQGTGAEMEKTLYAKATGERKEQHYQLFPAEKKHGV